MHTDGCTVRDMDNLTFSAGIRAFPLLAYANNPKENDVFPCESALEWLAI